MLALSSPGTFQSSDTISGSPAQVALNKAEKHFPEEDLEAGAIVFLAPAGQDMTQSEVGKALESTVQQIRSTDGVVEVSDPSDMASPDRRTVVVSVEFDVPSGDEVPASTLDAVRDAGGAYEDTAGGRAVFGGDAFGTSHPPVGPMEGAGLAVALIILLLTFGSLVAAGIPLLTAVLGVAGTMGVSLLAAHQFGIADTAPTLAIMLGLAVGIDYALLILSRHRRQLARGAAVPESVALATATAGSAIVFAGLTVIIALVGLAVAGVPTLTSMGLVSAGAVAMAVVFAIVVLPALMSLCGERLRPAPSSHAAKRELESARDGWAARWVSLVLRHPRKVIASVVLVLVVMAVPAASLKLALTDDGNDPTSEGTRQGYDLVADAFGAGANGPLAVLVEGDSPAQIHQTARIVVGEAEQTSGVAVVPGFEMAPDGQAALVSIIPTSGPRDEATTQLVGELRRSMAGIERDNGGEVAVTGMTAVSIDVSDKLNAALVPFTIVVVGLSLLLLMIAFRSWTIPIKATAGFLLSVGAAFGAMVAVFQWGWFAGPLGVPSEGPIASFVPIIVMAVLFGLAMDYEVFLVSSMREHYAKTGHALESIRAGSRAAGRVVVSAAGIMIAVFASFLFAHDPNIMPIAFALGVGVLVDAFVVRLTLVPAVLALLGDRAWSLPRWLDRVVPTVDVEGHELERVPVSV
jgi:RND superfamily putative drug exporter